MRTAAILADERGWLYIASAITTSFAMASGFLIADISEYRLQKI